MPWKSLSFWIVTLVFDVPLLALGAFLLGSQGMSLGARLHVVVLILVLGAPLSIAIGALAVGAEKHRRKLAAEKLAFERSLGARVSPPSN